MSITTELREWSKKPQNFSKVREDIAAIADRIDKAHEEAIEQAFRKGQAKGREEMTSYDYETSQRYIELPRDSEGSYIRPEDKMAFYNETYTVDAIKYNGVLNGKPDWMIGGYPHCYLMPSEVTIVKPDTQEKIDADAAQIDDSCGSIAALLRRQRELCEGKGDV